MVTLKKCAKDSGHYRLFFTIAVFLAYNVLLKGNYVTGLYRDNNSELSNRETFA